MPNLARTGKDTNTRGASIVSGATTVITNDSFTATVTSHLSDGSNIVAGSTTVFAEDKAVARAADGCSNGRSLSTGSTDVSVG